jgi:hypothetical protein
MMLKKIWCWLIGWPCKWQTERSLIRKQPAWGVFINVEPNTVEEQVHFQKCSRCGNVRTRCVSS